MRNDDIRAIKSGVLEIFTEFFNTKEVFYRKLLPEQSYDDLYKESKRKKYGEPILVVSGINFDPKEDILRDDKGAEIQIDCDFEIPTVVLEKLGLIPKYSLSELKQGVIEFRGDRYEILQVKPITMFDTTSATHLFRTVCL